MDDMSELQDLLADVRAFLEFQGHIGASELPLEHPVKQHAPPASRPTAQARPRAQQGAAPRAGPRSSPVTRGFRPETRPPAPAGSTQAVPPPGGRFGPRSPRTLKLEGDRTPPVTGEHHTSSAAGTQGPPHLTGAKVPPQGEARTRSTSAEDMGSDLQGRTHGGSRNMEGLSGSSLSLDVVEGAPGNQPELFATVVRQRPDLENAPLPEFPSAPPKDKKEALRILRGELGDCQRCGLCATRTHVIVGEGNPDADVLLVAGGPQVEDDRSGVPIAGEAGNLLNKILETMLGRSRTEVYLSMVIRCRPASRARPTPEEIATCLPFLERQISIIRPRVIIALGDMAAQVLLQTGVSLKKLRGFWFQYRGIPLMTTYHPGNLVRDPSMRRPVFDDMQCVRSYLTDGKGTQ